jgi:hypothetical protein
MKTRAAASISLEIGHSAGNFNCLPIERLGFAQRLFRPFALGDVFETAVIIQGVSIFVPEDFGAFAHENDRAVFLYHFPFQTADDTFALQLFTEFLAWMLRLKFRIFQVPFHNFIERTVAQHSNSSGV